MEETEFFKNVAEMRKHQIAFFKAKRGGFFDKSSYDNARKYEQLVDKYIKDNQPKKPDTQQQLFT